MARTLTVELDEKRFRVSLAGAHSHRKRGKKWPRYCVVSDSAPREYIGEFFVPWNEKIRIYSLGSPLTAAVVRELSPRSPLRIVFGYKQDTGLLRRIAEKAAADPKFPRLPER